MLVTSHIVWLHACIYLFTTKPPPWCKICTNSAETGRCQQFFFIPHAVDTYHQVQQILGEINIVRLCKWWMMAQLLTKNVKNTLRGAISWGRTQFFFPKKKSIILSAWLMDLVTQNNILGQKINLWLLGRTTYRNVRGLEIIFLHK